MHKNTVHKTMTVHANVMTNSNGSSARRARINIATTVDDAKRACQRWQPAAMVVMPEKHIQTKWQPQMGIMPGKQMPT